MRASAEKNVDAVFVADNVVNPRTKSGLPEKIPPVQVLLETSLFERAIRGGTIPTCTLLFVYYAILTWAHWAVLEPPEREIVCSLSASTSLLFLVLGLRWRVDYPSSASLISRVIVVVSINNAVSLAMLGMLSAFYGQVICQMGLGFLGVKWSRLFL